MIYVFLANGFEETEAICPVDLMRRAGLDVKTVAIGTERQVCSSRKIVVEADALLSDLPDALPEAVVLPGGMPGAENLKNSEGVRKLVCACAQNGGVVAAICAAPMVLGDLGLLNKKEAICYPGFEKELRGAAVKKRAVVVDGRTVTAIGPGASFEFGLKLVELLKDKKTADKIARDLLPIA